MKSKNLEILKSLVAIKSAYPDEAKLSNFLAEYLKNLGFKVDIVMTKSNRPNIVAKNLASKSYLAFYGHMDTVSADSKYERDPLDIWVEDQGLARGLGVSDMKGGIAAILSVAAYAQNNKLPIKIIFCVDEENISLGAHDLLTSNLLNDIDFLISAESGQVTNEKQPYSVCYGRRGRIALDVVVAGRKVHAAEHSKGVNAIIDASKFVIACADLVFPPDVNFGATALVVHQISGMTDSFSVPDSCKLYFSALTTPSIRHDDVINELRELARSIGVEAKVSPQKRTTPYAESYEIDTSNLLLKKIEQDIFTTDRITPLYTASVADENIFANKLGIPVISLGPIGGGDHTVNEWVSIQSIDNVALVYEKILHLYNSTKHN